MHKASRRPSHQSQVCRSHHPCALKKRKRTQGGAQCEGLLRIPIALHTLRGNEGEDSEKSKTRSLSQFYGPVVPVRRVITSRHTIGTQLAFPSINCSQPAWVTFTLRFFVFFCFQHGLPSSHSQALAAPSPLGTNSHSDFHHFRQVQCSFSCLSKLKHNGIFSPDLPSN
jgi:hypothetical protein